MPSAQEAREARRRKILARGSDRLAFIAGELPSISSSTQQSHLGATSAGSVLPSPTTARPGDAALIRLLDGGPAESNAEFDCKTSPKVIKDVHQQLQANPKAEGFPELETVANSNIGSFHTEEEERPRSLEQMGTGLTKATSLLTWDGLSHSIDGTQNYRASGALSLALFLVAQNFLFCAHSAQGRAFSIWVLPWPVAVVIVTDISLVFGALLLGFVRTPHSITDLDDNEVISIKNQLSQVFRMSSELEGVLGVGIVFLKTSQALFLDCSIYVVALTCGYSLAQNWQSALCL